MPVVVQPTVAADVWADQLIDAYTSPEGKAAKALDNLIEKLEKRSAELTEKKDKDSIMLRNTIDGELKDAKILREACLDAAQKRQEKSTKEKKARENARLAAGYHMASVKMFSQLANPGLKTDIIGISPAGFFEQEYHAIFNEYVNEMKESSLDYFKRFIQVAKQEGIEVKEEDMKTAIGEFEVWDFTEPESKPEEPKHNPDDDFEYEPPLRH